MNKNKQAFSFVKSFTKQNFLCISAMITLFFLMGIGEEKLSALLISHGHTYLDYTLAVVRMFLQTALSCVLVFIWYKKKDSTVTFSFFGTLKLFCSTFLVSLTLAFLVATIIGIPVALWLFLRFDFYMNTFFTSDKKGIVSCIGESFRKTKGFAKKYFVYNLKYLMFYFIITIALMMLSAFASLTGSAATVMSIVSALFTAVFMPYRFLIKCGFFDEYIG